MYEAVCVSRLREIQDAQTTSYILKESKIKIGPQCVHVWLTRPREGALDYRGQINKSCRAIMWLHTLCQPHENVREGDY